MVTDVDAGGFEARLVSAGLGQSSGALVAMDRWSCRLVPIELGVERVGGHRLGGRPDLAPDVVWPMCGRLPLAFVGQVALAEVPVLPGSMLPSDGLLSFFYDAVEQPWGDSPDDQGAWRLLWQPPGVALETRAFPGALESHVQFAPVALGVELELTHVPWESAETEQVELSTEEWYAYSDVLERPAGTCHRLWGHPDPVQGDMQRTCENMWQSVQRHGDEPDTAAVASAGYRAVDWRLVLQVDSQDEIGMMWGDIGTLYCWMPTAALAARRWDDAWVILQST